MLVYFCSNAQAQDHLTILDTDSLLLEKFDTDSLGSIYITDVEITGHKKTRSQIIQRELEVKKGSLLPKKGIIEYLENERNKVFNTDLFETVEMDVEKVGIDSLKIRLNLIEQWYIWPTIIFELSDRSFNEWWNNRNHDFGRIYYGIKYKQKNFRGMNESIYLLARFGFSNRFAISYNIPFLDKKQKTSLNISADYSDAKTVAYKTVDNKFVEVENDDVPLKSSWSVSVKAGKRYSYYDYHTFGLSVNSSTIADTIAILNPNYFLDGRTSLTYASLMYTYTKDKRDVRAYPLKGYRGTITLTKIGLGIFDDINAIQLDGSYYRFKPISKKFFYEGSIAGKLSYPGLLPYPMMRAFGYQGLIVRGYDNYVVEGQNIAVFRNTLKFQALSTKIPLHKVLPKKFKHLQVMPIDIYLKGYADAGYVNNNFTEEQNDRLTNTFLGGYGLGLDIISFYSSAWRFEYSFNYQDQKGGFYFYYNLGF